MNSRLEDLVFAKKSAAEVNEVISKKKSKVAALPSVVFVSPSF